MGKIDDLLVRVTWKTKLCDEMRELRDEVDNSDSIYGASIQQFETLCSIVESLLDRIPTGDTYNE